MLTNWYGKAGGCQMSNGFCYKTGGICRPTACQMMAYVPDDDQDEEEGVDNND